MRSQLNGADGITSEGRAGTRSGNPLAYPVGAGIGAALAFLPGAAFAHEAHATASGFVSGFTHPLFGLDHVVAMVAVGLWGGQLGKPAIWLLPVTFPLVMALGGVLGVRGIPLPGVEIGIALSAVALGCLVAGSVRAPIWIASAVVGAFAIFHGHAHGTELPGAASPLHYAAGFVLSTGLLHVAGIVIGLLVDWKPVGARIVRACGVLVACAGVWFLVGGLSG